MTQLFPSTIKILTVSELNEIICAVIDTNFDFVCVEGEVSNLSIPSSGHHYFTLKDEKSQIRAVLFRGQRQRVPFDIKNGQSLICLGQLGVYTPRGEYQIIVEQVEPSGIGSLHLALEQLKTKLAGEGLFDEEIKKPLPAHPRRIGVVTSPTGAAIGDIINVISRRNAGIDLILSPAKVQGEGAAFEIAEAIEMLNRLGDIDIIIVGRGGGSLEDLWAFNEEAVARAIYDSPTPIISAVGHESDVTISDLVADMRAPTPSAAAEMATRSVEELSREITGLKERLVNSIKSKLDLFRDTLNREKRALKDPRKKLAETRIRVDELILKMEKRTKEKIFLLRAELKGMAAHLDSLSPLAVLSRGFSIAKTLPEGKVIKDGDQVERGDDIGIELYRGELICTVKNKR